MPDERECAWGWPGRWVTEILWPSRGEAIELPDGRIGHALEVRGESHKAVRFEIIGPDQLHREYLGSIAQRGGGLELGVGLMADQFGLRMECLTPEHPIGHRRWRVVPIDPDEDREDPMAGLWPTRRRFDVLWPSPWESIDLMGETVYVHSVDLYSEQIHFTSMQPGTEGFYDWYGAGTWGHLSQSGTCDGLYLFVHGCENDGYRLECDSPGAPIGHRTWSVHRGRREEGT